MGKEVIKINKQSYVIEKPTACCHCDKGIDPIIVNKFIYSFYDMYNIVVTYKCPCCEQIFFAIYQCDPISMVFDNKLMYFDIIGGHKEKHVFSNEITGLSPRFVSNYNDAYFAEQSGCKDIVGIGYRRAFEFLIKDFAIKYNPEEVTQIKSMSLAQCVDKYFPDDETRELLLRALWIGNDFAHYESNHDGITIDDLKNLVLLAADSLTNYVKKRQYIQNITKKKQAF